MTNGYYDMLPGEVEVKILDHGYYVASKQDALNLSIGSLFTAPNGQWYVKVHNDYRRWTWT